MGFVMFSIGVLPSIYSLNHTVLGSLLSICRDPCTEIVLIKRYIVTVSKAVYLLEDP